MEIIQKTTNFQLNNATAVAMGKFDGIHIGHRRLLEEILRQKARGLDACVFTFDPAPAVLFGLSDGKELSTLEEKRRMFADMGVDILIEFPLNLETAATPAEGFVREYLCAKMRAEYIAAGEDISFGERDAGDARLLRTMGSELGFQTRIIEKVCVDGCEVSSTRIRTCVENGDMELVQKLLGSPYIVSGTVVQGNRIGRTIGFPTVNLQPEPGKLLPPNGVYYSRVLCGEEEFAAISNVGCKPTVTDERVMGLESYLYDFDRELYGQEISVELLAFRRAERHFENLEALQAQLKEDIAEGSRYHCIGSSAQKQMQNDGAES